MVSSSSSSRRTSKNTDNKNHLRMYEILNNFSNVSNNIVMLDISDDDDNLERNSNNHDRNYGHNDLTLSATYAKGI